MNTTLSSPPGWDPYDVWRTRVLTAEVRAKYLKLASTPDSPTQRWAARSMSERGGSNLPTIAELHPVGARSLRPL